MIGTVTGRVRVTRVLDIAMAGLAVLGLASCVEGDRASRAEIAIARMGPTVGNAATGSVTFTRVDGGTRVVAALAGVPPGVHGFHVHEFGDCSSPDAASAGGHWNPEGTPHAGREDPVRHVGDLGNVVADSEGVVITDFVDGPIVFGGPHSIVGRSVILHADADDLVSQPSGAAGARISCGVIEWADVRPDS